MSRVLRHHPWQRARVLWILPIPLGLFALGLWLASEGQSLLGLGLAAVGVLALALVPRRYRQRNEGYLLEPEGVRFHGRLFRKEAFEGAELPLSGRLTAALRLRFRGEALSVPLNLPGRDELLAYLGVDWRQVEGLEAYLRRWRGMHWLVWDTVYPPRESEEVLLWALGVYRRRMRWVWVGMGLLALGLLGAYLSGPPAPDFWLYLMLTGLFLALARWFILGWSGLLSRGWFGFNPLDGQWRTKALGREERA